MEVAGRPQPGMTTPPYLVEAGGEVFLDVATGGAGRERFALSERATALLVDDLGYGNRDVVPWLTAKTLVLARGAYSRDERVDARELSWRITGAAGGRDVTETELERLGEYLTSVDVEQHAVGTVREHVRSTRLSDVVSAAAVRSNRDRTQELRDIAKDL